MSAEYLSLHEREKTLEQFVGKPLLDLVCSMPTLPLFAGIELEKPEIYFYFVKYWVGRYQYEIRQSGEQRLPSLSKRDIVDQPLPPIMAIQNQKLDQEELDFELGPGYAIGWTSRVTFIPKGHDKPERVQLPTMDFDYDPDYLTAPRARDIMKKKLREKAELRGWLLESKKRKKPGFVHFVADRLLDDDQFLTFLGICGLMKDESLVRLSDPDFIFHALTARRRDFLDLGRYIPGREQDDGSAFSIYHGWEDLHWPYPDFFTTLRMLSGDPSLEETVVVDIV